MKSADIYGAVTAQIIAAIENGVGGFSCPWHKINSEMPVNVATKKNYRGVNVVSLWGQALARAYPTALWGTYRQWNSVGAQVRKGEKGTIVIFYKSFDKEESEDDEAEQQKRGIYIQASYVFNVAQVDGWTPPTLAALKDKTTLLSEVEQFVLNTHAVIKHGGDRACYRPGPDNIQMPERKQFKATGTSTATECYYSTLLHELGHWTGHKSRLNRLAGHLFGSEGYAAEELIAELSAAFLCAELGISNEPREDHAAYIKSWLKILKNDDRAIFKAASQAQKAAEYLHSLQDKAKKAA